MARTLARLNFEGGVQTAVEPIGGIDQQMLFRKDLTRPASVDERDILIDPALLANAAVPSTEVGNQATRKADEAGDWVAEVRFGFPQRDGQPAPGNSNKEGRLLVAKLGPDEFLLSGIGGAVFFHRPGYLTGIRMQILLAEEGYYTPSATPGGKDEWHVIRLLNGDETDRGIRFPAPGGSTARTSVPQPATGDLAPATTAGHGPMAMAVRIVLGRF